MGPPGVEKVLQVSLPGDKKGDQNCNFFNFWEVGHLLLRPPVSGQAFETNFCQVGGRARRPDVHDHTVITNENVLRHAFEKNEIP